MAADDLSLLKNPGRTRDLRRAHHDAHSTRKPETGQTHARARHPKRHASTGRYQRDNARLREVMEWEV